MNKKHWIVNLLEPFVGLLGYITFCIAITSDNWVWFIGVCFLGLILLIIDDFR